MKSCLKRIHSDMSPEEVIIIRLTDDFELTLRKNEKVTNSGELIVIIRNGRKVVINPQRILFFYTKEDYL